MSTQTLLIRLEDETTFAIPVEDLEQYRLDTDSDEVTGFSVGIAPFPDILAPVNPDVEVLSSPGRPRGDVSGLSRGGGGGKVSHIGIIDGRL